MNLENFHKYLENPSLLYQVSYQELKSLVLQYPYSPNLRYLLLIKSIQEKHKEQDRNLTMAAISVPDRRKLRQVVMELSRAAEQQEHYRLTEDFLELKDLSTLSYEMAEADIPEEQTPASGSWFMVASPDAGEDVPESPPAARQGPGARPEEEPPQWELLPDESLADSLLLGSVPLSAADDGNVDAAAAGPAVAGGMTAEPWPAAELPLPAGEPILLRQEDYAPPEDVALPPAAAEEPAAVATVPAAEQEKAIPLPKSQFSSWRPASRAGLQELNPRRLVSASRQQKKAIEEPPDGKPQDATGLDALRLAEKSVRADLGLATETLARVLELQHHFTKAIAMYEQLILQNPEKKAFFAAKIEELKSRS